MKTLFGTHIDESFMEGVLYLCDYDGEKLTPIREIAFRKAFDAIQAYANIPNPASQLAVKTKTMSLTNALEILHKKMADIEWQKQLSDYL